MVKSTLCMNTQKSHITLCYCYCQHRVTSVTLCHLSYVINTKRKRKKSIYLCLIKWDKCFQLYYNSIRKHFITDEIVKRSYSAAILAIRASLFWWWKALSGTVTLKTISENVGLMDGSLARRCKVKENGITERIVSIPLWNQIISFPILAHGIWGIKWMSP